MRKLGIGFFSVLLVVLIFHACTTEVELNAPYKSTTVVFGLLDPKLDTQYIKINKTYLGEGNNYDFALIRDSSEYKWEEFKRLAIEKYVNNTKVDEWDLEAVEVSKDPYGLFYAPLQTVYMLPTPGGMDPEATYKLVVDFHNRPDVYATTDLVKTNEVSIQNPLPNVAMILAQFNASTQDINYKDDVTVKWTPAPNVSSYDITLHFNYLEQTYADNAHTQLIKTDTLRLDYYIGNFNSDNLETNGGAVSANFAGEGFFSFLQSKLTVNPKVRRIPGHQFPAATAKCFELTIGMANEELGTYLSVNAPVTGVIQERPTYSNVSNGLGLFASRSAIMQKDIRLVGQNGLTGNLYALVQGSYCAALNFCDPDPTSDFPCSN